MDVTTRKVPRDELRQFIPNLRSIIAFENMQEDIGNTGDALSTAGFVVTSPNDNLNSARVLAGSANIEVSDGGAGADVTLDLTDTGIVAADYGSATRILILSIDAKGRITAAQVIKIDVSDVDGTLAADHGGTGQSSYVIGDLLYANGAASLARLADVAAGNVLLSGGVATAPLWGKVDLASAVSGVLAVANGGTGMAGGGFTGTGAYTNFTFTDGICTSAS
ncbi:hypothetical protein [Rhizorhabdus histidinilytica]|uniref:hypothetical protein n=1 Tax=Rhizorhabdus histidinilytica TaxID=439228 RepID=UPI0032209B70